MEEEDDWSDNPLFNEAICPCCGEEEMSCPCLIDVDGLVCTTHQKKL